MRVMHKISTYIYTLKQGIINIGKNKMFSLASVATMSACIFLFGVFYSIVANFTNTVKGAEEKVAITVFFDEDMEEDAIKAIGEQIKKRPEVSKIVFVSAKEAWESYKEIYPEKMNNIQIKLDKEKKILKNIEKMNIARQKYEEEREKIIRKSNKILILPTHKMNIDYKKFKNKININPKELAEIGEKNTITNMLFGN